MNNYTTPKFLLPLLSAYVAIEKALPTVKAASEWLCPKIMVASAAGRIGLRVYGPWLLAAIAVIAIALMDAIISTQSQRIAALRDLLADWYCDPAKLPALPQSVELESLRKKELQALCDEFGIAYTPKQTKAQLIEAISES